MDLQHVCPFIQQGLLLWVSPSLLRRKAKILKRRCRCTAGRCVRQILLLGRRRLAGAWFFHLQFLVQNRRLSPTGRYRRDLQSLETCCLKLHPVISGSHVKCVGAVRPRGRALRLSSLYARRRHGGIRNRATRRVSNPARQCTLPRRLSDQRRRPSSEQGNGKKAGDATPPDIPQHPSPLAFRCRDGLVSQRGAHP